MRRPAALFLVLTFVGPALADEGMWTFDAFPSERVAAVHGFRPDRAWLDRVRAASLRLSVGCSAGFVSPEGLLVTNHHCVEGCLADLSSGSENLVATGFRAATRREERRCPDVSADRLLEIRDVTARVRGATEGKSGEAYLEARERATSRLEAECQTDDGLRCEVVSLYGGGIEHLYVYRRFDDVRLVFAPEVAAAFFGGDPDNFMFPRYALDVAFLRAWEGDAPAKADTWFPWSEDGIREGALTFVTGNPAGTSRLDTVAELEYERDVALPRSLLLLAEERGFLREFAKRGPDPARFAAERLSDVENSLKARRGRHEALLDRGLLEARRDEEAGLRRRSAADPGRFGRFASAWDEIAEVLERRRAIEDRVLLLADGEAFDTRLFDFARDLVRIAEESAKPSEERLPEYAEARLPALRTRLLAPKPFLRELETASLANSLMRLRERLGPDDRAVRSVLGSRSPEEVAETLVAGTRLDDPERRRVLLEGGVRAVADSADTMVALARALDAEARALRVRWEEEVEAPLRKARERIALARFAAFGRSGYPDATFSPRLSFGRVAGWSERGNAVPPFTPLGGAFRRHTGSPPFDLPDSWLASRERLDLEIPFNFVTDNDVTGGNSGSPVLDGEGRLVGIAFDGNIHSLGGEYGFDAAKNRAVAVDARGVLEALRKVYRAEALVREILESRSSARKSESRPVSSGDTGRRPSPRS